MPALTIAIPTYNRNEALKNTIELLLPQLEPAVCVKVFDNCSVVAAADTLQAYGQLNVAIIRNEVNVGMSGNFIKCFEQCESEWLWVLGDDDLPAPNAVETILSYTRTYPDVVFIKFDSNLSEYEEYNVEDVVSVGQEQLIENMKSFGNFLFLSSGVYRMSSIKESIKNAYYFAATYAPQVALVLDYTRTHHDSKTLYSRHSIVEWKKPVQEQKWNDALLNKSLPDLVFLVASDSVRSVFLRKMAVCHAYNYISGTDTFKSYVHANEKERYNLAADYFSSHSFVTWAGRWHRASTLFSFFKVSALMLLCENRIVNKLMKSIIYFNKIDRSIYNKFLFSVKDTRL